VVNIVLSGSHVAAGALVRVCPEFAPSTTGTVNIYSGSTSGPLLERDSPTVFGDASQHDLLFHGGFDGTNWKKEGGWWLN
jgi:hypothetical protein